MEEKRKRCAWVDENDARMKEYHDTEWGVPLYEDRKIFEFLVLEIFQAGLSWRTILHKREHFRKMFADFSPKKIAAFEKRDVVRLLGDAGIVRNRAKIEATINNAKRFLKIQKEFSNFSKYMWGFVGGTPIQYRIKTIKDYRQTSDEAIRWAHDLKARGFRFLGPTTLYAHMQAVGMVNDHMERCFRKNDITKTFSHS
ncbi:MAG: DNA-3-methyladenine glycosylase I [Parcubacteria group bacterium Gr01-1014_17]|nr:MAG: DNA-3-methyladenine glycosylase I [Parcubacteria group bacterium Gr01-1014_17]